jgi:hypothetical protein
VLHLEHLVIGRTSDEYREMFESDL